MRERERERERDIWPNSCEEAPNPTLSISSKLLAIQADQIRLFWNGGKRNPYSR
jgi:hypothetical protein